MAAVAINPTSLLISHPPIVSTTVDGVVHSRLRPLGPAGASGTQCQLLWWRRFQKAAAADGAL